MAKKACKRIIVGLLRGHNILPHSGFLQTTWRFLKNAGGFSETLRYPGYEKSMAVGFRF